MIIFIVAVGVFLVSVTAFIVVTVRDSKKNAAADEDTEKAERADNAAEDAAE